MQKNHFRIINPMSEMDRRGQITIPGGTTHEGVAGAFGSIYTDRNFLKPLQIYNTTERGVFLTTLFEVSYMCSVYGNLSRSKLLVYSLHISCVQNIL